MFSPTFICYQNFRNEKSKVQRVLQLKAPPVNQLSNIPVDRGAII